MRANLSLFHRARLPLKIGNRPPLLLLLHGVGSNEDNLFKLALQFDERFLILSVRAPNIYASGNYAWFEVAFTPQGTMINERQAESSRQALIKFISEATQAYNADPHQIYLAGFSQGAIMSASVALTRPDLLAGGVLMSGRILPEIHPLIAAPEYLRKLSFLVIHGTADTVLPIHHGKSSRDLLSTLPVRLDYREYAMGHEISQHSLGDVNDWLSSQLDSMSRGAKP